MMRTNKQSGFVSIVVCLIIMSILSLISIGFAQLMSREQRQVVDRQLSTQAFYAAESGINDAILKIKKDPDTNYAQEDCPDDLAIVDEPLDVSISCVVYRTRVGEVTIDSVSLDPSDAVVLPLKGYTSDGTQKSISKVEIQWIGAPDNTGDTWFRKKNIAGVGPYTWVNYSEWSARTGVLRATLIPFKDGSTRESLIENMATLFLSPSTVDNDQSSKFITFTKNESGSMRSGKCPLSSTDDDLTPSGLEQPSSWCSYTITDIPEDQSQLQLAITSIYKKNNVVVKVFGDDGTQLDIGGVQASIDATGRVANTLRRIRVMYPLRDQSGYTIAAVRTYNDSLPGSSGGVCKLLKTAPAPVNSSGFDGC